MRRSWTIATLAAVGAALGLVAELVSDATLARSATDLATGWTLLACGLWGWRRRPGELCWPLLAGAGIAWFAGNFADADSAAVSSVATALVYLHRGPLVHAVVSGSRPRSRVRAVAVVAGYACALTTGSASAAAAIAAAIVLAALALRGIAGRPRMRRPELLATGALVALASGLMLAGVTALADVSSRAAQSALLGYEAALAGSALLLAAVPAYASRTRALLADLVVELGPARRPQSVRHALRRALGDPTLEVGYWLPGTGRYVDRDGRPVELPGGDPERAATIVERGGERIAALVHDPTVLDDPSLVEAVQEATALVLANARLEAEVAIQLGELRASRRRIVEARDEQRRRLAMRLTDGAGRRLDEVADAVGRARSQVAPEQDLELLDLIERELDDARAEVRELARGVHPRALTERGLSAALTALADRAGATVELTAPAERLPAATEAAVYFVCSEALANVAKYARASRVRCEVTRGDGRVSVSVADDGVGGADPARGSGLRGLADRIDALGGSFAVRSPRTGGTIVRAELPLDGAQSPV